MHNSSPASSCGVPAEPNLAAIRLDFIRFVYILTVILGTTTGLLILLAPGPARSVIGFPSQLPEQDPIVFGMLGCIWLGIASTSLLGLRAPLKFLPLLLVQLVYKSLWFLVVFTPLVVCGEFPLYGTAIAVGNALWIILDLRAIPFAYLLCADQVSGASDGSLETGVAESASRIETTP